MKVGQPDKREKRASDWLQAARQHHLQERELRLSVRQCPILYPCNKEKMRLEGYQCPSWVRKHKNCTLIVMKYKEYPLLQIDIPFCVCDMQEKIHTRKKMCPHWWLWLHKLGGLSKGPAGPSAAMLVESLKQHQFGCPP
jgi:hypothetical protein